MSQRFADAHRALREDPTIQFGMGRAVPPKPPELPGWLKWLLEHLKPVGRFFEWVTSLMPAAPLAQFLLWTVIGLLALTLVWMIVTRIRSGEWRMPLQRKRARQVAVDVAVEEEWAPDFAPARAWLDEADALAARGLYAEAVRHLLFRSVEDIKTKRPQLVRPSLTSRELAAATGIPAVARELFARIAGYVEHSLFGGRPVVVDDWQKARAAYADFALPGQWRG
ncbi:DUF4129 domain-containing protein [Sphingomonas panacisoli]|uniref:DUF4129 domain-containing protein n=1 Tax=Sphingomonas panacisoli TaxID=1813879 RepID=A0A5B8LKM3_9SPHN|nr:DUF4129 domain-containing protein [Sphingomonas panacisoli]QDZ08566.1 DUF4129 domain-containing protein [Sphingomonas panacisoli]